MPSKTFDLPTQPVQKLTVSWKARLKQVSVEIDGRPIGTAVSIDQLSTGLETTLSDGRRLRVWTGPPWINWIAVEINATVDGEPLLGTAVHPRTRLRLARNVAFVVGSLTVLIGALGAQVRLSGYHGWVAVVAGVLLVVAGFLTGRGHPGAAAFALGVMGIEALLSLGDRLRAPGAGMLLGGITIRALVLFYLYLGLQAAKALRDARPKRWSLGPSEAAPPEP